MTTLQKTSQINVRMRPDIKSAAETVFNELGLTPTQAITLFYRQVSLQQAIPFELKIPNEETIKAIEDARAGQNVTRYSSIEEMREQLEI